jgi:hypothetical protein
MAPAKTRVPGWRKAAPVVIDAGPGFEIRGVPNAAGDVDLETWRRTDVVTVPAEALARLAELVEQEGNV